MTLSNANMDAITNLAKLAAKKVIKTEEKGSALTVNNDDNDNIVLCNSSESLESSAHKDEVSVA